MAMSVSPNVPSIDGHVLKRNWGWFFALGILEIILGTIAVGASAFVSVVTVVFFGWLLLIGGVLSVGHSFWRKHWKGFFLDLATGVLYVVCGLMMVGNPLSATATLTLLIAMFLLIEGLMRRDISMTIKERVYQVAFVCLIVFAAMVIFNDITKLNFFSKVKP